MEIIIEQLKNLTVDLKAQSSLLLFESCLYFSVFPFTLVAKEDGLICESINKSVRNKMPSAPCEIEANKLNIEF